MRYYYKDNNWLYLGFPYDREMIQRVKSISGAKYNPQNKEWYFLLNGHNNWELNKFIQNYGFVAGRVEKNNYTHVPQKEIYSIEKVRELIDSKHFNRKFRTYQIKGIHYMLNHTPCINGDDCGLGKTAQTIGVIELLDLFPALIITPASVKDGWKREWGEWIGRDISIINSKDQSFDSQVCIINYDLLFDRKNGGVNYKELSSINWKCVVFDEIHFIKNSKSQRSKASKTIVKNVQYIYGLSGTIAKNRPYEIINPLSTLKIFNKLFGNFMDFIYRYCNAKKTLYGWDTSSASNLAELSDILTNNCYIRREKRTVLKELPPISFQNVNIQITNKRNYDSAKKDIIAYLKGVDSESAERAKNAEFLVRMSVLKKLSIEGKIEGIKKFLTDWCEDKDKKIVVFGRHREPLQILAKYFDGFLIQGGLSGYEKTTIINQFASTTHRNILFASMDAVGTGVDGLQKITSYLAFIELPDTWTDVEQVVSRIERQGQKDPMTCYWLLNDYNLDSYCWEFIQNKRLVSDAINKGVTIDKTTKDFNSYFIERVLRNV